MMFGLPSAPRAMRSLSEISSGCLVAVRATLHSWNPTAARIAPTMSRPMPIRIMSSRPSLPSAVSSDLVEHLAEASVQEVHHLVDLLRCGDECRPERDPVRIEATEQAVFERPPPHPHAESQLRREAF